MRYLKYLWYLLKHKFYVFIECCKLGIPWRGLVHDLSKFYPSEFYVYAHKFYHSDGSGKEIRSSSGYYNATAQEIPRGSFEEAWFLHQKRNAHHWQYWSIAQDTAGMVIFEIPEVYLREMVADWRGAARVQNTRGANNWYRVNKNSLQLHPRSRQWIEKELGYYR
jgi:hypothetical protein